MGAMGAGAVRTRVARWLAWSLVAFAVGLGLLPVASAVARAFSAPHPTVPQAVIAAAPLSAPVPSWLSALLALGEAWGFAVLGAVLVSRQSARALGWLFCALGVELTVEYFTDSYAICALFV